MGGKYIMFPVIWFNKIRFHVFISLSSLKIFAVLDLINPQLPPKIWDFFQQNFCNKYNFCFLSILLLKIDIWKQFLVAKILDN